MKIKIKIKIKSFHFYKKKYSKLEKKIMKKI